MLRLLNFAAKVVAPGVSHVTAMTKVIVWGRCEEVRDHGSRILHDSGRNHVHRGGGNIWDNISNKIYNIDLVFSDFMTSKCYI